MGPLVLVLVGALIEQDVNFLDGLIERRKRLIILVITLIIAYGTGICHRAGNKPREGIAVAVVIETTSVGLPQQLAALSYILNYHYYALHCV